MFPAVFTMYDGSMPQTHNHHSEYRFPQQLPQSNINDSERQFSHCIAQGQFSEHMSIESVAQPCNVSDCFQTHLVNKHIMQNSAD